MSPYGRSPAIEALKIMRKINALPETERVRASAAFIRNRNPPTGGNRANGAQPETKMKSFEDIGDMPLGEIKPPPLIPRGSYLVGITKTPEKITSSQKQTPGWSFHIKFYQPRPDVDMTSLQSVLAEREMSITDFEMDDIFYITDNSAFMLKDFLINALGFPENVSMNRAVAESSGKQYIATIVYKPTSRADGTVGLRAEIGSRARAS